MDFVSDLRELPMVFTVQEAKDLLNERFRAPLKFLASLEKRGVLVRLKRGHYAVAESFDPVYGANLLHSPSYISFETALSYYGLIPERTESFFSVVDGRPMTLETPVGIFNYSSQSRCLYAQGMALKIAEHGMLAIATPEKALLDTLSRANLRTVACSDGDILQYAIEGLRIEEADIRRLSLHSMRRMADLYRNLAPRKLVAALRRRG